jgi:hypothetical protein
VAAGQAQTLLRNRWIARFDAHSVVDGKAQFLLAAEVPFRRLDRDVSKQKLDLVQLATGKMADPRAAAPKIMRRECFNSGTLCGGSRSGGLSSADTTTSFVRALVSARSG